MLYDPYGVDLDHFRQVRGWLEYIRVDESLDDAGLAESGTSRCGIGEVLEQANDTVLDFNVSFRTQQ